MNLFGINVTVHPLATMTEPNRKHKRRRWMSESYHRRIQKKWDKRFGTHQEPCAFFISPGAVGMSGRDTLYVHPERMAVIRNLAAASTGRNPK